MAFTAPHRLTLDGCDLALDDMKGGASIRDLAEPARTQMRDKLRALPGRWFPGSGGVLGTAIASGAQNFPFHATCTPWDHAPVDLLCREAGAHSAMMTSGAPYNATMAGGLLCGILPGQLATIQRLSVPVTRLIMGWSTSLAALCLGFLPQGSHIVQ